MRRMYGEMHHMTTVSGASRWIVEKMEPHVCMKLKSLFPSISEGRSLPYSLPCTDASCADLEWFMQRYPLEVSDADYQLLTSHADNFRQQQQECYQIVAEGYTPTERHGLAPKIQLRPYQKIAVDYAEKTRRFLLVDDMGLGKTIEGLAMSLIPGVLPIIYVVEPALVSQWQKQIHRCLPHASLHVVNAMNPYELPAADIYLVKYTQLARWVDVFSNGPFKAIIFDEVQSLRRGDESSKGEAAINICKNPHLTLVVGMTGTVVYNLGVEVWNVLNVIAPQMLGSRDEFIREWCGYNDRGVVKDPDALGTYLKECHVLLRRTREMVGQVGKQAKPEIITVTPDNKEIVSMNELAKSLAMQVITAKGRDAKMTANGEFDRRLRLMTGLAKARQTASVVRMIIESGEPVLLFGYHHEVYRIWQEELGDLNPVWFTGNESVAQKDRSLQAFMSGESNLLIMSVRSGLGIDQLQHRCRNVVFGELDWSPQVIKQCITRLDRDGQNFWVYVYYVISSFGSDPSMMDTLAIKEDQCRGIQDPGRVAGDAFGDHQVANRIYEMAQQFLIKNGIELPVAESMTNQELASCL